VIKGSAASGSHSATYTLTVTKATAGGAVANAGFESGSLSPWTCQSGSAVVKSPVHSGAFALSVNATSSQTGECDQTLTLTPNHTYTLSAYVQGQFAYIGVTGGASTWAQSSTWTQLSVSFTTDSTGKATIYTHGWYGNGTTYADDFTVS